MKLSASNIAWTQQHDEEIYRAMQSLGFTGLEIAPTRWFAEKPYDKINEAVRYAKTLKDQYGFSIASMQSIWYGHQERIAGSTEERKELMAYTEKAFCFAEAIECPNLVFGCPKNRAYNTPEQKEIVIDFLAQAANLAEKHGTVLALEPNPSIYGTNFANTTAESVQIIKQINSPALRLNLDFGTIIENKKDLGTMKENISLINHVHISEPMLKPIIPRTEHAVLRKILENTDYCGYISLEMGNTNNSTITLKALDYMKKIFG